MLEYGNTENLDKNKIYVWFETEYFNNEEKVKIDEYFKNSGILIDPGAAIGAGASGLNPELQAFIRFTVTSAFAGFVAKIGADVWDVFKKQVAKIATTKPDPKRLSYPEDFLRNHAINFDLLFHIHTEKQSYLVMLTLDNEEKVGEALGVLPEFIDKLIQSEEQVHRIYWNEGRWEAVNY